MADFALGAEAAIVDILLSVAAHTGPVDECALYGRYLVGYLVTRITFGFPVGTVQAEARFVVVEIPSLPGAGVVTGFALGAEGPLVNIFLFVTTVAFARCVAERRRQMALLAFDSGVPPGQGEARAVVIELLDLPVALLMAGVATIP